MAVTTQSSYEKSRQQFKNKGGIFELVMLYGDLVSPTNVQSKDLETYHCSIKPQQLVAMP